MSVITKGLIGQQDLSIGTGTFTRTTSTGGTNTLTQIPKGLGSSFLNVVRFADQFSGADWGAKVAAAIADLPSTGGIVDARGFVGAQTCAANPFAGVTKPVHLLWGNYTVTTTVKWTLAANGIVIEGIHGQPGASFLQAGAALNNAAIVEMGDNLGSYFGMRLEWLRIHCNQNTGSTGILMRGLNEDSGLRHVSVSEWLTNGVKIDNSVQVGGDFELCDINLNVSTGAGISGDGISIPSATGVTIRRVTIVSTNLQTSAAIHVSTASGNDNFIYDLHVEKFTDGVLIDLGCVSVIGVTAFASTVNAIHIKTSASVFAANIMSNGNGAGFPVILNDITGTSISSANPPAPFGMIPFYCYSAAGGECWIDINGFHVNTPGTATNSVATLSATQTLTNKSTSAGPLAGVVASGTATLTSNATLGATTAQTAVTVAAAGALTTDAIEWSYATAPSSDESLCIVSAYMTSGNVNFVRANPTAASRNVTAIVINWRVVR